MIIFEYRGIKRLLSVWGDCFRVSSSSSKPCQSARGQRITLQTQGALRSRTQTLVPVSIEPWGTSLLPTLDSFLLLILSGAQSLSVTWLCLIMLPFCLKPFSLIYNETLNLSWSPGTLQDLDSAASPTSPPYHTPSPPPGELALSCAPSQVCPLMGWTSHCREPTACPASSCVIFKNI